MRRLVVLFLASCLALVVAGGAVSEGRSAPASTSAIVPSPAYTADQLNAPPGDNWLSNMGNLSGWRYSSLTQVNKSNVATLKEAWHINLGTCPAGTKNASCGSLEANAVVADGTYYITTPKGDAFALDAVTGKELWHFVPTYEPGFNVGNGGRQPGVAIAEGKVFAGTRDGYIIALDQMLGGQIWKTEVSAWRKGGKVSAAPIYVNGLVLVGDASGDNGGVSASMHAYDSVNGR
jgi:glucose dehydrogenase